MADHIADAPRAAVLLDELSLYRPARHRLLSCLDLPDSNRDPLAEFAEHFAAAVMGGKLCESRVQASWDIEHPDGTTSQVRFLANPGDRWVNEHLVHRIPGVTWYVPVMFEAFVVTGVLAFPPDLAAICAALRKRHPRQDETLQFTRRNWWAIRDDPDHFRRLGMRMWLPPFAA